MRAGEPAPGPAPAGAAGRRRACPPARRHGRRDRGRPASRRSAAGPGRHHRPIGGTRSRSTGGGRGASPRSAPPPRIPPASRPPPGEVGITDPWAAPEVGGRAGGEGRLLDRLVGRVSHPPTGPPRRGITPPADPTAVGPVGGGEEAEQSALAGTVGPHEGEHLARGDVAVEGPDAPPARVAPDGAAHHDARRLPGRARGLRAPGGDQRGHLPTPSRVRTWAATTVGLKGLRITPAAPARTARCAPASSS